MHFVYILFSEKINRFYIGETPDVQVRLNQHNFHYFTSNFTKSANDWILKLAIECVDKKKALFLEKFIKRMKSRKFIEKAINNPSILQNILDKKSP